MFGNEAVSRLKRTQTGADRYGVPIFETTVSALPKALFAPRHTLPALEVGRQPVVVEPTLYWHRDWPDLAPGDRVRVRGTDFEVLGVPSSWRGDGIGGLTVLLKDAVEGVP